MTHEEALAAVRGGQRVAARYSIHSAEKPEGCPGFNHTWRTISCDGNTDVVECYHCGKQEITSCNFDEEYS